VRPLLLLLAAVASIAAGGCGVVDDMRTEYLANRALADANAELSAPASRKDVLLVDLARAYRLRGQDPRFAARLAEACFNAGQWQRALECYRTAAPRAPEGHDLEIALCELRLGRTEPSLRRINRAIADAARQRAVGGMSAAQYANLLNNVGYNLVDAGVQVEEALAWIEEAVRLEPLVPAYVDSLGWAYFRRGRYQDAAFYLERAFRLEGEDDAEMLWHLGAVHARLGRLRRAVSELHEALRLDPTNAEARRVLSRLRHELPAPART
jgi:tetratricopeptide (TPR) repeat protein